MSNKRHPDWIALLLAAVILTGTRALTGRWPSEVLFSWLGVRLEPVNDWLRRHDVLIDEITVWALALGFAVFGTTKAVSWLTLHGQEDATMVGVTLKRQKVAEAVLGFGMSTLYGMTLWAYYVSSTAFGFWERLAVRTGLFIAMMLASFYGIRFVYWLRKEASEPTEGAIPLARSHGAQDEEEEGEGHEPTV